MEQNKLFQNSSANISDQLDQSQLGQSQPKKDLAKTQHRDTCRREDHGGSTTSNTDNTPATGVNITLATKKSKEPDLSKIICYYRDKNDHHANTCLKRKN